MIRRLIRLLGIRREIQRRLAVNLTFDDLPEDAAAVRNGARLALVALRGWLDGVEEPGDHENANTCAQSEVPHVSDASVGERCWFWDSFFEDGPEVRSEGVLSVATTSSGSTEQDGFFINRLYTVLVNGDPVMVCDPSK